MEKNNLTSPQRANENLGSEQKTALLKTPEPRINFKPFFLVFLILGIILLIFCIGAWFYTQNLPKETACTMDAKICPDGTAVGRSGPKCEFAACPVSVMKLSNKKYVDRAERFGFDYPDGFEIREQFGGGDSNIYYYYLNSDKSQLRVEAGVAQDNAWYEQIKSEQTETINNIEWTIIEKSQDTPPGFYINRGDYYVAALDMDSNNEPSKTLRQILETFEFNEQCKSDSDCKNDESCTTIGPEARGIVNPRRCVKKNAPLPL